MLPSMTPNSKRNAIMELPRHVEALTTALQRSNDNFRECQEQLAVANEENEKLRRYFRLSRESEKRAKKRLVAVFQAKIAKLTKENALLREELEKKPDVADVSTQCSLESATTIATVKAAFSTTLQLQEEQSTMRNEVIQTVAGVQSEITNAMQTLKDIAIKAAAQGPSERERQLELSLSDFQSKLAMSEKVQKEAIERYCAELKERREIFNRLQDLAGNVRVFCRIRPSSNQEVNVLSIGSNAMEAAGLIPKTSDSFGRVVRVDPTLAGKGRNINFEYDGVFSASSSQEEVFEHIFPLLTSVLDGYNVCLFAFGQTGSGKTYSMEGTEENPGVNPRAISELFQLAAKRLEQHGKKYTFELSAVEIYNDNVYDLMSSSSDAEPSKLDVRVGNDGVEVVGLQKTGISSADQAAILMKESQKNRQVASTRMNIHSSRSHCVLSIYAHGSAANGEPARVGRLHLVDLAGSERIAKSGSDSDAKLLREAQHINKSLSALGDVISSLATRSQHIPYRNSKLTFLLQDSLGRDSKTIMMLQVSPSMSDVQETFSSLNFAARVRGVELNGLPTPAPSSSTRNTVEMDQNNNNKENSSISNRPSTAATAATSMASKRKSIEPSSSSSSRLSLSEVTSALTLKESDKIKRSKAATATTAGAPPLKKTLTLH